MLAYAMAALVILFSSAAFAGQGDNGLAEVEAEGSCRMEAGTSTDLARAVALFIAKKKALEIAGKYLSRKSVIDLDALKKDEIYSQAAAELSIKVLEENRESINTASTYHVRIRAQISATDIIRAERKDQNLEKRESQELFSKEMEPHLPAEIAPGKDIAKAFRLVRRKEWRVALIYLDRLIGKYPNWGDPYLIKALISYVLHEPVNMKRALVKACRYGNQTGCDDLKGLKKVHEHDFGNLIIK